MSATISSCGAYRYLLRRHLEEGVSKDRPILFIMLNPSIANATEDDPTIRRCIGFAKSARCNLLTVVNLYALRATDPRALKSHVDPIGPDNNLAIAKAVEAHWGATIVAAWGNSAFARDRATLVSHVCGPFLCLGITKDGAPRHPLFTRADAPLMPYPEREL